MSRSINTRPHFGLRQRGLILEPFSTRRPAPPPDVVDREILAVLKRNNCGWPVGKLCRAVHHGRPAVDPALWRLQDRKRIEMRAEKGVERFYLAVSPENPRKNQQQGVVKENGEV